MSPETSPLWVQPLASPLRKSFSFDSGWGTLCGFHRQLDILGEGLGQWKCGFSLPMVGSMRFFQGREEELITQELQLIIQTKKQDPPMMLKTVGGSLRLLILVVSQDLP